MPSKNACAVPGCAKEAPPKGTMCIEHWCLVPQSLKVVMRACFDPTTDVQVEGWQKLARQAVADAQLASKAAAAVPALRGLTEIQPWGWAIVNGYKPVENRSWAPWESLKGQPICLHGGKKYSAEDESFVAELCGINALPPQARDQGILGVAWLDRVIDAEDGNCTDPMLLSEWFSGRFGWIFRDAVVFPEPIACRGMQGLWAVAPKVAARVWYRVQVERALRS